MTPSKPLRIYVDTSVIGGCFDAEFATESRRFFGLVTSGRVRILISVIVLRELQDAPNAVREFLASLPRTSVTTLELAREAEELRDAYIAAGVVSKRSLDDATHVALATTQRADAIVSWNFKHIVRLDRIRGYNQVNWTNGYGLIQIVSPQEVRIDDEE